MIKYWGINKFTKRYLKGKKVRLSNLSYDDLYVGVGIASTTTREYICSKKAIKKSIPTKDIEECKKLVSDKPDNMFGYFILNKFIGDMLDDPDYSYLRTIHDKFLDMECVELEDIPVLLPHIRLELETIWTDDPEERAIAFMDILIAGVPEENKELKIKLLLLTYLYFIERPIYAMKIKLMNKHVYKVLTDLD